ncbi:MAG: hypothetical protein VKJ64_21560 [Leptolyngbyaceae bacterium]|nr:hypothetical protein [Leptolyngbyaceae bacterium]
MTRQHYRYPRKERSPPATHHPPLSLFLIGCTTGIILGIGLGLLLSHPPATHQQYPSPIISN